ncbi:solute carrier family 35 member F6-like [Limulus polyphemus]|uniref:Solute carrier family 35 member F6-like n=1 Tax=Limulus polyphemus TaxID=6850 RepID=A0ABM1TA65_LIMPO|nr:solute carrier family 35 member F6-like [Limulus polyphemus]
MHRWTKQQIAIAVLMVTTGSINTLATKWADISMSEGKYGNVHSFDHPFLQATAMFLGEFSCLAAFKLLLIYYNRRRLPGGVNVKLPASIDGNRNFNPLIFLPPAMCDMIGTSVMYIGLNMTNASSFQMFRETGTNIRELIQERQTEMEMIEQQSIPPAGGPLYYVVIEAHYALVEFEDVIHHDEQVDVNGMIGKLNEDQLKVFNKVKTTIEAKEILISFANKILRLFVSGSDVSVAAPTGDLLIICGQVITATQMVFEEKFITKHNVAPLQAVGWEGLFGFSTLALLLVPMYYIPVGNMIFKNPDGNLEDAIDGFYQIGNNWQVAMGVIGTIVSIAFFNFAGISVTKEISATTRMVLDSVRTLVIWVFSMIFGWEHFIWIQLIGFLVLLGGMWLYNDTTVGDFLIKKGFIKPDDDLHPILTEEEKPQATNEEKGTSINTNGSLPL